MWRPIETVLCLCILMPFVGGCGGEPPTANSALFQIMLDGKWGFINDRGQVVAPPEFEEVNGTGVDVVCARSSEGWFELRLDEDAVKKTRLGCEADALMVYRMAEGIYAVIGKDGPLRVYDSDDRFKCEYDDDWHIEGFREGLSTIKTKGKYGFVDREGQVVIAPRYDLVGSFHEGIAAVMRDKKWGFIDRQGQVIVEPTFEIVDPFASGVAVVFDGKACWFIKQDGTEAFNRKFRFAGSFSDGLAQVKGLGKDDLYGYIDKSGTYVIPPKYKKARDFHEGLAAVAYVEKGARRDAPEVMGYIDPTGNLVIRVENALELWDFKRGLALVETDAWTGYINKSGKCVWKTDKAWTPPLSEQ